MDNNLTVHRSRVRVSRGIRGHDSGTMCTRLNDTNHNVSMQAVSKAHYSQQDVLLMSGGLGG